MAVGEEEDGGGVVPLRVLWFPTHVAMRLRHEWATQSLLQDDGAEFGDRTDEFIGEQRGGANLLPVLVQRGGGLEVERVAGGFALGGDLVEQRLAAGAEEGEDALGFGGVLGGCAGGRVSFFARHQALADVSVDAAGVFGVGR